MTDYCKALIREISSRKDEIAALSGPATLYIGGGTPSVLPLAMLRSIIDAFGEVSFPDEFTIEVNPDDIVRGGAEYAAGLKDLGVTRVSMGVQSFDDRVLRWMNRRHSSEQARQAFRILRQAGFDNVSMDLIFGYGDASLGATLDSFLELRPEHISAYQLSIEQGSALEEMTLDGRFVEASDDLCGEQYDVVCRRLRQAGYRHYEISNFALPGREAVHNSGYWDHSPYVGLGPAAHSFDGRVRSWNPSDVEAYVAAWDGSSPAPRRESETLSREELTEETIMLGLRTLEGVDENVLRAAVDEKIISKFVREGALVFEGGRARIPEDHFFVSDNIISNLI